jgi:hypothetical protein
MSSFDRLTNLARGVLADGQKRLDAEGGLAGVARRAGAQVRSAAESAREAVHEGLSEGALPSSGLVEDPALVAAREEVEGLRLPPESVPSRPTHPSGPRGSSALSEQLAALDVQLRSGQLDKPTWEAERTRLLDAHDREATARSPRRRTL